MLQAKLSISEQDSRAASELAEQLTAELSRVKAQLQQAQQQGLSAEVAAEVSEGGTHTSQTTQTSEGSMDAGTQTGAEAADDNTQTAAQPTAPSMAAPASAEAGSTGRALDSLQPTASKRSVPRTRRKLHSSTARGPVRIAIATKSASPPSKQQVRTNQHHRTSIQPPARSSSPSPFAEHAADTELTDNSHRAAQHHAASQLVPRESAANCASTGQSDLLTSSVLSSQLGSPQSAHHADSLLAGAQQHETDVMA